MMVKTICTCDRCGKTFDEVNSKSIKIVPARAERKKKSQESKKNGLFCGLFDFINRYTVKDFCPECIEEIKGFIQKGAIKSENSPDKH